MAEAIDGGSSSGGSPSPLLSFAVLLLSVALVVGLVVALCTRAKKARRNKEDRRHLKKRVNRLRHLLPLLHPASEEEENSKDSGGATTTATVQAVRTVLARRLDTTMAEADRLATRSSGMCCGLARCDAQARRLERTGAAVDEVYARVLPVVSQIDATESVVQMLGALQRRTLRSQQHGGDDDANPLANSHITRTPSMQGPDGRTEFYDRQPLLSDDVVDDQASTGRDAYISGTETVPHGMIGP